VTAQATARRVLAWAAQPAGRLPEGPLWEAAGLARPDPATLVLAAELIRAAAARLGAGAPPFADRQPVGAGPVLLAAAIGGRRQPGPARRLVEMLPATRPARARPEQACWSDLVARHALVSAALVSAALAGSAPAGSVPASAGPGGLLDEPLTETLLRASPLTAVLHRPNRQRLAAQTTGDEVEAAAALLERPRGLAVLTASLAAWSSDTAVLDWRVALLSRLGQDYPALVLDTYAAARLRHGADWDLRLRWARRALTTPGAPDPLAMATIRFWVPLARIRRAGVRLADARPLLTGHRPALELVHRFRFLTEGAR
jgi:hypothetical protein